MRQNATVMICMMQLKGQRHEGLGRQHIHSHHLGAAWCEVVPGTWMDTGTNQDIKDVEVYREVCPVCCH